MTPRELVPSLDTCQRLKAAGWTQVTVFRWWLIGGQNPDILASWSDVMDPEREVAAPTLAELLAALPDEYRIGKGGPDPELNTFAIYDPDDDTFSRDCYHANPAEAAALLYLALHEVKA